MSDNETIADIIAEMRRIRIREFQDYADRFDAAHRREVQAATTENSSAVGNAAREMRYLASRLLREWQDAVGSNPKFSRYGCMVRRYEKEFDELVRKFDKEQLTAISDRAKLREAVEKSRRIASDLGGCRLNDYWKLNEIVRVCDAALAAPPRNCDRFATVDEAREAHEAICEKYGKCHNGCPLNNEEHYSAFDCFEAWLFAQTEGGTK